MVYKRLWQCRLIGWRLSYRHYVTDTMDTMVFLSNSTPLLVPWRYRQATLRSLQLRTVARSSKRRPEHSDVEDFYTKHEVKQYLSKPKNIRIQTEMTLRALQLMKESGAVDGATNGPILDLGCGACISGTVLHDQGHQWVGIDLSHEMLKRRKSRTGLGVIRGDIFTGLPFADRSFAGCLSISTLQWAFRQPAEIICSFFWEVNRVLYENGACVCQFYPANYQEIELVLDLAARAKFYGGLLVTDPHGNSTRKLFLCLVKQVAL